MARVASPPAQREVRIRRGSSEMLATLRVLFRIETPDDDPRPLNTIALAELVGIMETALRRYQDAPARGRGIGRSRPLEVLVEGKHLSEAFARLNRVPPMQLRGNAFYHVAIEDYVGLMRDLKTLARTVQARGLDFTRPGRRR